MCSLSSPDESISKNIEPKKSILETGCGVFLDYNEVGILALRLERPGLLAGLTVCMSSLLQREYPTTQLL